MTPSPPTESRTPLERTALILETNNLEGGHAPGFALESLHRVLGELQRQSCGLTALCELVITHHGWLSRHQATLERVVERTIRLVELPEDTDYYDAKNAGFDATSADVVVFADSDCIPDPRWLEELLAPLASPEVVVVAGRTSYPEGTLGQALSTLDFMYFASDHGSRCCRNFYANNVAMRREIFATRRYATAPEIYRGPCQVLGMRLHREAVAVHFAPAAHTVHRLPDSWRELATLRWLRGADTTEMAPAIAQAAALDPAWVRRLGPALPLAVLGARLCFSLRASAGQRSTTAVRGVRWGMPDAFGPRRLAIAGVVVGFTALDAAGSIARVLDRKRGRTRNASGQVLSYHAPTCEPFSGARATHRACANLTSLPRAPATSCRGAGSCGPGRP